MTHALIVFTNLPDQATAATLAQRLVGERLAAFDVVVKSPGISPNKPEAVFAAQRGTPARTALSIQASVTG